MTSPWLNCLIEFSVFRAFVYELLIFLLKLELSLLKLFFDMELKERYNDAKTKEELVKRVKPAGCFWIQFIAIKRKYYKYKII